MELSKGSKNLEINLIKTQLKSEKSMTKDPLRDGENLEIDVMKTWAKGKKPKMENLLTDSNQEVS